MPPTKKPRHRHTPAQLAALGELHAKTDSPTVAQRNDLAAAIGLEPKSVEAYFRNKRASTKKRLREASYSSNTPSSHSEIDKARDDGQHYPFPGSAAGGFITESSASVDFPSENMPNQVDDFQKVYSDEGQSGMLVESQHILATKKAEEDHSLAVDQDDSSPPFPPGPDQPSLTERGRRSATAPSALDSGLVSRNRRASSRRSETPYSPVGAAISLSGRPRRARPDPAQLAALKRLFAKTPTPTIEERSALAHEIGMEIGKVTNWFRNLRQSARKRERKIGRRHGGGSDDDPDYTDSYFYSPSASASASRAGTPTLSLEREEGRLRSRRRPPPPLHSSEDEEDEEEPQEAVTPSPSQSPSPASSPTQARVLDIRAAAALHDAWVQMADWKDQSLAADALLLLEFQATSSRLVRA